MLNPEYPEAPSSGGLTFSPGKATMLDEKTLCQETILRHPTGATLVINGGLAPYEQEEVLQVSNVEDSDTIMMRVYLSESNQGSGVLVESADRLPVALIETRSAVRPAGKFLPPRHERKVRIFRGSPAQWEADSAPFLSIEMHDDSGRFVARSGANGPVVLTAGFDVNGKVGDIIDANNTLMAAVELRQSRGTFPLRLHVRSGVDAAVVVSVGVAMIKLL